MNIKSFCQTYFKTQGIPIIYFENQQATYASYEADLSFIQFPEILYETIPKNPLFYTSQSDLFYGLVTITSKPTAQIIIGPVSRVPITPLIVQEFLRENHLSLAYKEQVDVFLRNIPILSISQFLNQLILVHFIHNGEQIDLTEHFLQERDLTADKLLSAKTQNLFDKKEALSLHDTYFFEQDLYQTIQSGQSQKLEKLLTENIHTIREGQLAHQPLRQAKNIFISTVTKVGMLAAIPGGMDVEQTYELMDLYIQEVELKNNIEAVQKLQYQMLFDFCHQLGQITLPEHLSSDILEAIYFIRNHTNEAIRLGDVAKHINRSVPYLTAAFKREMTQTVNQYITHCKVEEAKNLLKYTNKSFLDISTFLCFSSQAYFQSVFKKITGLTPLAYRKLR